MVCSAVRYSQLYTADCRPINTGLHTTCSHTVKPLSSISTRRPSIIHLLKHSYVPDINSLTFGRGSKQVLPAFVPIHNIAFHAGLIATSEQLGQDHIFLWKCLSVPVVFNYAKDLCAILICNWNTLGGACWNLYQLPVVLKFKASEG